MEKISYPPLISHLQERADFYNSLYQESQLKYGSINKQALTSWLVTIVEPIVKATSQHNPDTLPQVFKSCYTELLGLLGSQLGLVHEFEYQSAWLLLTKTPHLVAVSPSRLLKAMNSALVSVRAHQPEDVFSWIDLMEMIAPHCKSVEEFLVCGRVNAWLGGMAHLKARALESFALLPQHLQKMLQENTDLSIQGSYSKSPWTGIADTKRPEFMGEAGGFVGFGGPFTAPPQVALVGNHIVATDKKTSCALFADCFGKVILSDIPVSPEEILRQATNKALEGFKSTYGHKVVSFEDISSSVMNDSTLVFTRHSSHYLFIYGWS